MSEIPTEQVNNNVDNLIRNEEEMMIQANLIYYLALGILLGLVMREVNKKTKLPYSPMMLFLGIMLGLMQKHMGWLGESTSVMGAMHPHIILFVFIPILLFESAFNIDWYVFKRAMINILVLAGPGVCWGAILIGLVFKILLFYGHDDMSWYEAFTLGAVLSATDPVAVVALLKELGASVRFNTLIESEALFNDGTAMVFFLFFSNLAKGEGTGFVSVVGSFVQNSIVGPVMGIVIAFLVSLWTRRVVGDDVLVTWLTFVFCYLAFYFAEFSFFHTSGILTVICLGLFWSAFGKTKIRPESEQAVHTVWSFIQYSADTLIFLLVGIIVGTEIIEERLIYSSDWIKMIFFFIFMIGARYVMIMSFWPILKNYGYPLSQSELIVLVYGGLRGALGLCLSLLVGADEGLPKRFRHLTVFYMASMAALTNLINGTTCKALVDYLNMIEQPTIRKKIYKSYLQELIVTSDDKQKELADDQYFAMTNWDHVKQLTGSDKLVQNVVDLTNEIKQITGNFGEGRNSYEGISDAEIYGEVRYRTLRILKGLYYDSFEEGMTEEDACHLLVESSNINLDQTKSILNLWEVIYISFTSLGSIQYWFRVKDYPIIGRYAQQFITRHLGFIYDVTTSFIHCSNEALSLVQHLPVDKNALTLVIEELQTEINKAELYLGSLHDTFPEILRAIQTRRASHSILIHQRHYLEDTRKNGLVDDQEYNRLKADINQRLVSLENFYFAWEVPTFHSLVMQFPIFSSLSKTEIQAIVSASIEKRYLPNELIYERGMTCQFIYIITRGNAVDQLSEEHSIKKGLGSLLTYANIITVDGKCISTCRALTDCVCNALQISTIKSIMETNTEFEDKVYLNSVDYLVKVYHHTSGPLGTLETRRLTDFLRTKSQIKRLDEHNKIDLKFGGYIFKGEIQSCLEGNDQDNVERYDDFCYVPPKEDEFTVNKQLVILVFDEDINDLEKDQVMRFNLSEHEDEVDKRYFETGIQPVIPQKKIVPMEYEYLEI